jgi:hypothetical protein
MQFGVGYGIALKSKKDEVETNILLPKAPTYSSFQN